MKTNLIVLNILYTDLKFLKFLEKDRKLFWAVENLKKRVNINLSVLIEFICVGQTYIIYTGHK